MVLPDMARGVRWLSQRSNRGELSGYRVGRTWRMTHRDVEDSQHRSLAVDVLGQRFDENSRPTPHFLRKTYRQHLY
jgi:hypothetical protein